MKPTIVTLSGNPEGTTQVQFEEIFGEYSELRGRGRARRSKRKLTKQENKRLKRLARIKKRADAQQARQQKRSTKVEMAQQRRMTRKQGRVQRRALGKEEEGMEEDNMTPQVEENVQSQEQQSQPLNQEGDSTQDNQGSGEGEYETTQDGDVEAGEQEEAQADESEEQAEEQVDSEEVDSEQGESDEESGFTGDLGFDGVIAMSPEDIAWDDYFSSADGERRINPKIKQLSRRIEQNKELISVLNDKLAKVKDPEGQQANDLKWRINRRTKILNNLETELASYSSFEGDYSEARGGKSAVAKRKAEVRAAKKEARKERKAVRLANKKQARLDRRAKKRRAGTFETESGETQVENELKPEITEQKIEIPGEETGSFDGVGTGLIGIDEIADADAPEIRRFDLKFSNASGDTKPKIDVKNILIGVGVGVLAIYLIKKYAK